jgi:hypothetical protein
MFFDELIEIPVRDEIRLERMAGNHSRVERPAEQIPRGPARTASNASRRRSSSSTISVTDDDAARRNEPQSGWAGSLTVMLYRGDEDCELADRVGLTWSCPLGWPPRSRMEAAGSESAIVDSLGPTTPGRPPPAA